MLPSDAGRPRPLNRVRQQIARLGLNDVQRTHLRAAGRSAIGKILPVLRRLVPVKRNGPVRRERVRVDQNAVLAVAALAHIKHRLILHPLAPRVEVILPSNLRRSNAADGQQLRQPLMNRRAPRKRIQHRPGVSHLLFHPLLRLRSLPILQPPVVVNDFCPM